MALPAFFNKASLAAMSVLRASNQVVVAQALERHVIGLAYSDDAIASPNGLAMVELSANLLARLYPRVCLVPRGKRAVTYAVTLAELMRQINPRIELVEDSSSVTILVCAGSVRTLRGLSPIRFGSSGWSA